MKDLFYKPIKIKHDPKDVLFWGCLHYDHACESWDNPLWKMRGFKSVEEHNTTLIDNWNKVASDDTVGFLLGDTMFGVGGEKKFMSILRQLKFNTLYICAGNHHAGWKQVFEAMEDNEFDLEYNKKIIFIPNYVELYVNGQAVVASHYPILSWNGMGKGAYMLYSHVHGNLDKSELGKLYKNSGLKQYEVSVELNPFPINFLDLTKVMGKVEGNSVDHHTKDINASF